MNHRRDILVLLLFAALAIGLTFPLALNFATHAAGAETDAPTMTWNYWWIKHALFNLRVNPLSTDYLFYPIGVDLIAYALTFLNGLLALPIQFASNTLAANNALVLFSLTLSAFGMYLLARDRLRRVGLDERAGIFAGALYGFGAYHLAYVAQGRPDLAGNHWIPFYLLFVIRALESPRRAWKYGTLAGLFFVFTAWTEITYAAFLVALTALYFGFRIADFGLQKEDDRRQTTDNRQQTTDAGSVIASEAKQSPSDTEIASSSRKLRGTPRNDTLVRVYPRSILLAFTALVIVAAIGTAPIWYDILAETQRYGDYWTLAAPRGQILSADLLGFILPAALNPLVGRWTEDVSFQTVNAIFVGIVPLALFVWAMVRERAARVWGWIAIAFAVLMLGPTLTIADNATNIPLPFALVQQIPILKATRFPIRLDTFFMLGLALAASYAAARGWSRARADFRFRTFASLFALFALAEQLAVPIPLTDLRPSSVYKQFSNDPGDFTILELPLGWRSSAAVQGKVDPRAQFYQSLHQKRLIGGTTSRNPQFKFQYFNELPVLNSILALEAGEGIDDVRRALDREAALEVLRFFNIHHVVVNRALTDPRAEAYIREMFPLKEVYRDDERTLYRVTTALPFQGTVDSHNDLARLNFDDAWGRPQVSSDNLAYRWATTSEARVWLPLTRRDYRIAFLAQTPRYEQKVNVRINGYALDPIIGTDTWDPFSLHVPSVFLRNGLNELVFSTELTPSAAVRLDDYRIGATTVVSPVDIAATGAGFNAGRFGEIFVAGRNVIENKRGYHLVAINAQSGAVERVGVFDTFASVDESRRMVQFIDALPRGEIVAGVAVDDVSKNLQTEAVDALKQLGVDADVRYAFRTGHAFIGVKGAQAGLALEIVDGRFPANVSVGKNVRGERVSFALGPLFFEELR